MSFLSLFATLYPARSFFSFFFTNMFRTVLRGVVGVSGLGARLMSSARVPVTRNINNFPVTRSIIDPLAGKTAFDISKMPVNNSVAPSMLENLDLNFETDNTMYADSVLRKRRLKMKKHKLRKRRKEQRSLMKRLGKI